MNKTTPISEIRNAIEMLENEQEAKRQLLRQQFQLTYEGLKPVNLLKSAVQDISSTPFLATNLVGTTTGLALGYITRKIIIGPTASILRSIIGSVLQFGVTNVIANHSTEVKSLGQYVKKTLFGKRKVKTDPPQQDYQPMVDSGQ